MLRLIQGMKMEMESHGSVSIMKKQSQHKTTGQSLWREPVTSFLELCVSYPCARTKQFLLKNKTSRIRQPCAGTTRIFTVSSQ